MAQKPTKSPNPTKRSTSDPRRSMNLERVLETLRVDGPSSQAGLARRTGLSAATINAIVRDLKDQGAAEIRPLNGREGVVTLIAGSGLFIAVEIAERSIHGVVYSFDRRLRVSDEVHDDSDLEAALRLIRSLVSKVGAELAEVDGIAIAMQAPVEKATGAITSWCNSRMPGWAGVPLRESFQSALGVHVIVDNDANLAALAEWTWGVGRGVDDFLYVRSSGGVGGGLVIDGSIYRGGNGMAGDMGHVALEGTGEVCYCGSRGCLTTLVSERAIVNAVRTSPGAKRTLSEVIVAARKGDAACQRVLAEAGDYLGRALANAAKVMAPSVIAVGGELGGAGPLVFDGLLSSIELSNIRAGSSSPQFVPGILGPDAALLGAVAAILTESGKGMSELEPWMTDSRLAMVPFPAALAV
ncbi:ROK family transcriptional regulator [Microbacterium sp. B2969]|uniref:ROK family transcriptional regulator n=1 Tax=Microbacterium alkaliflavum TaxID=3248839 RepID=A0ABW7QE28_9MICO